MTDIEIGTRESQGPLDSPVGAELRKYEKQITKGETQGIEARWEFGRVLLRQRQGKQLPDGLLAAIRREHGISKTEVWQRMQFAELCPTKDEVLACASTYGSWNQVKRKALPKKPKAEKAEPEHPTNVIKHALAFKQWRNQLAELNPADLTRADLRELDELEQAITALRVARERSLQERKAVAK